MRVAFLLLICLVAGSQATFFDDLKETLHGVGTTLTTTIHAVGDQAKVVGTSLLQTAAEQGKQLASQALQSLLMGTLSSLQKPDPATEKRSLSELLEQSKHLTDAAKMIVEEKLDKMNHIFTEAIDRLTAVSSQLTQLPVNDLIKKMDEIVIAHHLVSDDIQSELVSELTKLLGHALSLQNVQKRGTLTDTLSSFGQELTRFFQPHFQAVQRNVCKTSELLKTALQAHATVGNPVLDGQNALTALKDSVSDIFQQAPQEEVATQ